MKFTFLLSICLLSITHLSLCQTSSSQAMIARLKNQIETLQSDTSKLIRERNELTDYNRQLLFDNAYLKSKIELCQGIIKNDAFKIAHDLKRYEIKLVSCKGESATQNVKIELLIVQLNTTQHIKLRDNLQLSFAVDLLGNTCPVSKLSDSNSGYGLMVPSAAPYRLYISYKQVMPNTEMFSMARIEVVYGNSDGGSIDYGFVELRNLKIEWQ